MIMNDAPPLFTVVDADKLGQACLQFRVQKQDHSKLQEIFFAVSPIEPNGTAPRI